MFNWLVGFVFLLAVVSIVAIAITGSPLFLIGAIPAFLVGWIGIERM